MGGKPRVAGVRLQEGCCNGNHEVPGKQYLSTLHCKYLTSSSTFNSPPTSGFRAHQPNLKSALHHSALSPSSLNPSTLFTPSPNLSPPSIACSLPHPLLFRSQLLHDVSLHPPQHKGAQDGLHAPNQLRTRVSLISLITILHPSICICCNCTPLAVIAAAVASLPAVPRR